MTHYIEDILHILVDTIGVNDNDSQILTSISKQCKKGTALTDRQYELVKNKLVSKADLLASNGIEFTDLEPRLPLREIDRSKYIKLVLEQEITDHLHESSKSKNIWFKVRFPFSKKHIIKLENIVSQCKRRGRNYIHNKGSHEHFFKRDANIALALVDAFASCNFEIDPQILDYANKTRVIKEQYKDYLPHFSSNKFFNVNDASIQSIDSNDMLQVKDKHIRHGYVVSLDSNSSLLPDIIANRTKVEVLAHPEKFNMHQIAEAFELLDRYPLVVLIDDKNEYEQVKEIYNAFNMIVPDEKQSVLFRIENTDHENYMLNDFIKNHNLNNWVDSKTKIVYIKKNKLPKVLLNSGFKPYTALGKTSYRTNTTVLSYLTFNCDLILFNDDTSSSFNRFSFF